MELKTYRLLFELGLDDSLSTEDIQSRINRYDMLTGTSYLSAYQERYGGNCFSLLVRKQVIDLWQEFQNSLNSDGSIVQSDLLEQVRDYVYQLSTIQAYQFYEKFMETYGVQGLNRFFPRGYYSFYSSLVDESRYYSRNEYILTLKINRDFLDNDRRLQLLLWLEEYVFLYSPEKYLPFVTAILCDETIAALFSMEDQRILFDSVIDQPGLSSSIISSLKARYLTAEEKLAEQDAAENAKREAERQRQLELVQELRDIYAEKSDGTFGSDEKFLDRYDYRPAARKIAASIVYECLDEHLSEHTYQLNSDEAGNFLAVCAVLVKLGVINFRAAQDYILKAKECIDDAGNTD